MVRDLLKKPVLRLTRSPSASSSHAMCSQIAPNKFLKPEEMANVPVASPSRMYVLNCG